MHEPKPSLVPVDRDDPSLWFRPLRLLLNEGKPVGPTTILVVGPLPEGDLPLGAMSCTRRSRLLFWPVLSRTFRLFGDDRVAFATDHVTLELPSGRIHVTGYSSDGEPRHQKRAWRIQPLAKGVALWFVLAIRRSVLADQLNAVERNVGMPASDEERRMQEFHSYTQQMRIQQIRVPQGVTTGQFLYCLVYVDLGNGKDLLLTPELLQLGSLPNGAVRGWCDDQPIAFEFTRVAVGETRLVVAAAMPPGELADEFLGFPQVRTHGSTDVGCRESGAPYKLE